MLLLFVVRREEANEYLRSLNVRANQADERLVKSTEFLLPAMLLGTNETPRMTASELSQVFDTLNAFHAQVIDEIEYNTTVLVGSPLPLTTQENNNVTTPHEPGTDAVVVVGDETQYNNTNSKTGGILTPHHWSIGMPLSMVTETDYETDRNSYPSSSASSVRSSCTTNNKSISSSTSQTPTRRQSTPGTPSTPTIRTLRLR